MVALTVTPSKGNAGARYYPHSGHLGLTPVKVEGVVRTRVEEDGKPATASAVTVSLRCYEARVGRVGVVKSNILVEQSITLWSPPSGAVWGSLGATELPFKIVLPANAAGNSTFSLQEYRVYWRIEAAIHTPHIPGIGTRQVKCFDVNLVRYNKPSTSTLPRRAALARPSEVHNSAHYELEFPRQSAAPLDPIPVSLRIHPRHGTSVQRVTFALERRIDMFDASPASSMQQLPSPGPLMRQISRESSPSESSTTLACSSSTTALLPASPREERPSSSRKRSPSPASQGLAAKTAELVLATAEVADIPKEGVPLQDGLCTVNASLQVPLPKSNAHWGVGETMQGGLARVRFYITAKVQIAWASGSDTVDACQQEVSVVAVDDAERLRVHNKYSMKRPATSPSATENQEEVRRPVPHLPSPPPSPGHSLPASRSGKAARRPHTASGARDASQRRALPLRPRSRGNEAAVFEPESVRAWERELDRIAPVAQRPRSSSALRLFSSKKQRSPEPRADLSLKSSIGVARPVVVPSTRTAEVLEWEAEVERFSSASAREAVLKGHASRAPLSV